MTPANTPLDQFWKEFGSGNRPLAGLAVHDPFSGGGSTLVEAARLGADTMGCDVDPLAVEIARHELAPPKGEAIEEAAEALLAHLRAVLGHLFPASDRDTPLHYFSLPHVVCPGCGAQGLLYRSLVLARDANKMGAVVRPHRLYVFSPDDFSLHTLDRPDAKELRVGSRRFRLDQGTFRNGRYKCGTCRLESTHRDLQTGRAPRRLIAVEFTQAKGKRELREPTELDLTAIASGEAFLLKHRKRLKLPQGTLLAERRDQRPRSFGIETPQELFHPRQLAVFGEAMRWVAQESLDDDVRRALRLALSNALTSNNKLCGYATDYGRLSALFSVRGYSLPVLAVELNPLHPSAGRGTIAASLARVVRSTRTAVRRHTWSPEHGKVVPTTLDLTVAPGQHEVVCATAQEVVLSTGGLADFCVFDPPYYDYIAYSELSEFHRVWLGETALGGEPLLPPTTGEDPAALFGESLGQAMSAALSRSRAGRPLAFTYHSAHEAAWRAVGLALDRAGLLITAMWPVRSDGHMGHHSHPGNCEWDIVVVARRNTEVSSQSSRHTTERQLTQWLDMVRPLRVNDADKASMRLALEMAASRRAQAPSGMNGEA